MGEREHKCLSCEIFPWLNIRGENGELSILEKFEEPTKHGLLPPCIVGGLLHAICSYIGILIEKRKDKLKSEDVECPLLIFYLQALRELKASMILSMNGYPRSACSLLRGALEFIVAGAYFNACMQKKGKEGEKELDDFIRGKLRKSVSSFVDELKKEGVLEEYWATRVENCLGELSEFVHPRRVDQDIGFYEFPLSPPKLEGFMSLYREWVKYSQHICAIFLFLLLQHLEAEELTSHEEMLELPRAISDLQEIGKELRMVDQFIVSSDLREVAKLYNKAFDEARTKI